MTDDLNAMAVFAAVAEARGFRVAGERLGVSVSAVSQTLRKIDAQLGVALLRRTARSVRLTEAGERLYASVRPAIEEVRAVAGLRRAGVVPPVSGRGRAPSERRPTWRRARGTGSR